MTTTNEKSPLVACTLKKHFRGGNPGETMGFIAGEVGKLVSAGAILAPKGYESPADKMVADAPASKAKRKRKKKSTKTK